MTRLTFNVRLSASAATPEQRAQILANPGFGKVFTDHMITVDWSADSGWTDGRLEAYAPITIDPAAVILHYGQSVFEGLKAFRQVDGTVAIFRPDRNAARLAASCRRLALPEFPAESFIEACELLVSTDGAWVPSQDGSALYIRPFVWGTEVGLGVRPSEAALFQVIASPVANYFGGKLQPVALWLTEDYVRAAPGGTGAVKCGGNYAGSLIAQQEAAAHGCQQVAYVDAVEHRWLEELGGMNLFLVTRDGKLVTPELTGTILEGVTRASVIALARDLGYEVEERKVDVDEWRKGAADGAVTEVFATGTAAAITPISVLRWPGGETVAGNGSPGPTTMRIRAALMDIQYGRVEDTYGWLHPVALA